MITYYSLRGCRFSSTAASHRVFTTYTNICGTPLLLPLQHILVSPQRAQAYTVWFSELHTGNCNHVFLSCIFIMYFAGKHFIFQVNPFKHLRQTVPTLRHAAASFAGRGLMLLKTNKAWGACGEQRGSAFKGRSEPTSAFVWKTECQECGLFQETSMHPTPFGQIIAISAAQDGWWGISASWTCLWVMVACQSADRPLGTSIYAGLFIQSQDVTGPVWEQVEQDQLITVRPQPVAVTQWKLASLWIKGWLNWMVSCIQTSYLQGTWIFACVFISPSSEPPLLPDVSHNVQSHQRLRWYACKWR